MQEAASPNLRAGLTPHIKALRSSLACDDGQPPAAAAASPTSLPRAVPPLSDQPGSRRASLAEAPRANLLFEPAAEAEVREHGKADAHRISQVNQPAGMTRQLDAAPLQGGSLCAEGSLAPGPHACHARCCKCMTTEA